LRIFPNYILLKNPKCFGYRSAQWSCVRLSAGVKPHAHGYNQGGWPCRKREVMLRFVSFFLRNLLEAIANSFSTVLFYYRVFWAIYFCWRNQLSVLRYSRLYRYSIMPKLWRMRFQYFIRKTILCYYIDIILQLWSTAKFRIYIFAIFQLCYMDYFVISASKVYCSASELRSVQCLLPETFSCDHWTLLEHYRLFLSEFQRTISIEATVQRMLNRQLFWEKQLIIGLYLLLSFGNYNIFGAKYEWIFDIIIKHFGVTYDTIYKICWR